MADRIQPDRQTSPGFSAGERALIKALAAALVRELRAEGLDAKAA